MKAALLPDLRTDLISPKRLGHGWAYQNLVNQSQGSVSQQAILSDIRMIFYDTIDILFYKTIDIQFYKTIDSLWLVYHISVEMKE